MAAAIRLADRLEETRKDADPAHSLESVIWAAADMLHWRIAKAQFRDYLFPLLFLKRISDVYDEERAEALEESDGDEAYAADEANHRFQIPPDCHWQDLRAATEDVGAAIITAMSGIEHANPDTLSGIFGGVEWTNKDVLPDAVLSRLIEHLSGIDLSNRGAPGDVLGRVYEYLLKQFADLSKRKHAGEFYTPRPVIRLLVNILNPLPGETVYDPACGTGGMLLEALQHIRDDNGGKGSALVGKLFGQEKELATSAMARMNLFLHDVEDFEIARGDTINNPAFHVGDKLRQFDCVLANPPFSMSSKQGWDPAAWAQDPWGRNAYGVPPASNADFAWLQHMLASAKDAGGRMAVVLPDGVLFRGKSEAVIRKGIVEADLIEAVIKLGPGLFYGTGLPPCIIVLRKQKAPERAGKVLFVDASLIYTAQRANNVLTNEQADAIFGLYDDFTDQEGLSRVASLDEIRAQGHALTVSRYVERPKTEKTVTYEEAMDNLDTALEAHERTAANLDALLREWGFAS